jgi:hypothetical protein
MLTDYGFGLNNSGGSGTHIDSEVYIKKTDINVNFQAYLTIGSKSVSLSVSDLTCIVNDSNGLHLYRPNHNYYSSALSDKYYMNNSSAYHEVSIDDMVNSGIIKHYEETDEGYSIGLSWRIGSGSGLYPNDRGSIRLKMCTRSDADFWTPRVKDALGDMIIYCE